MSATISAVARMDGLRANLSKIEEEAATIVADSRSKLAQAMERRKQVLNEISLAAVDAQTEILDIPELAPVEPTKRRGRPKKEAAPAEAPKHRGRPKKEVEAPKKEAEVPKKRGRPKKEATSDEATKHRGRPKGSKNQPKEVDAPKRGRGRPKKVVPAGDVPAKEPSKKRQPKNSPDEQSLLKTVWDVIDRPIAAWRKLIPELPAAVDGLNAEEIQTIIQFEGKAKLPTSVKQVSDQISQAIAKLKNELKIIGREDGRYYAIAKAVPPWKN
jgi:hypothetical protein